VACRSMLMGPIIYETLRSLLWVSTYPKGSQGRGEALSARMRQHRNAVETHLTLRSKRLPCPDYARLSQVYEGALRYSAQLQHSLIATELVGETARYAAQLKNNALKERDAAKQRLFEHWWSCSICKEAAQVIRTNRTKEPNL
jgi:hypothetical protein